MSPLPVLKHQRIATNLTSEFVFSLKNGSQIQAYQPLDYLISEDTLVQPDMLVIGREINKKYLDFPPSLVVEIISPSNALKDRHIKFDLYQS